MRKYSSGSGAGVLSLLEDELLEEEELLEVEELSAVSFVDSLAEVKREEDEPAGRVQAANSMAVNPSRNVFFTESLYHRFRNYLPFSSCPKGKVNGQYGAEELNRVQFPGFAHRR